MDKRFAAQALAPVLRKDPLSPVGQPSKALRSALPRPQSEESRDAKSTLLPGKNLRTGYFGQVVMPNAPLKKTQQANSMKAQMYYPSRELFKNGRSAHRLPYPYSDAVAHEPTISLLWIEANLMFPPTPHRVRFISLFFSLILAMHPFYVDSGVWNR